jgi:hypothetical protein
LSHASEIPAVWKITHPVKDLRSTRPYWDSSFSANN